MARRPRIGICTAIERARWSYWDTEAYLLDRNYVDAVQAAGGIALMPVYGLCTERIEPA